MGCLRSHVLASCLAVAWTMALPSAATGGVQNAGTIYVNAGPTNDSIIRGDVTNSGEFVSDFTFGNRTYLGGGTVEGDFIQTADGVLRVQVYQASLPDAPRLHLLGGDVVIAGTVAVQPVDPDVVRVGDRFHLVHTDAPIDYSATMVSFFGLEFEPQLVPGEGLYAVATVVPEPAGVLLFAGPAVLLRRRPRRR